MLEIVHVSGEKPKKIYTVKKTRENVQIFGRDHMQSHTEGTVSSDNICRFFYVKIDTIHYKFPSFYTRVIRGEAVDLTGN